MLLDACRENPFAASMKRTRAGRSVGRGLGRFEPRVGDTLIAFATRPDAIALDGNGPESPFTMALVKHLATPGLDVRLALGDVRDDVLASTGGKQEPYLTGSLGHGTFAIGGGTSASAAGAAPAPTPTPADDAVRICREVSGIASPATLAVLERQYRGTPAGECIAARIAELRTAAMAAPPPMPAPAVAPDALRPGRAFRDCADVCPEMVVVPAGSFTMGSAKSEAGRDKDEGPPHRVTIARPFAVGKFEVAFTEWDACAAGGGCASNPRPSDEGWGRGRRPVINVSWNDAKEYVAWLSRKTGKTYRLLSEAEWEYAARAGTTTRYAFGDTISKSQAQFFKRPAKTVEVGSFRPNAWGLHDMHGNVFEWVEDAWQPNYQGAPTDGSVWPGGDVSQRVLRGGGWYYDPGRLRSALRYWGLPDIRFETIGFRVARTL